MEWCCVRVRVTDKSLTGCLDEVGEGWTLAGMIGQTRGSCLLFLRRPNATGERREERRRPRTSAVALAGAQC